MYAVKRGPWLHLLATIIARIYPTGLGAKQIVIVLRDIAETTEAEQKWGFADVCRTELRVT